MKKYGLSFYDQVYGLFKQPLSTVWFELNGEIDKQTLEKAVNKALYYHPVFKTEIMIQGGLMHLQENPLPVKVRDLSWDKGYIFAKSDNNNYPWIIACSGRDIIFTGSHVITDGGGVFNFLQTVIRLYLELTGVKFKGDFGITTEDEINISAEDPFEMFASHGMEDPLPKHAKERPIVKIPDELYETDCSKLTVKQFTFNEKDIKALAKGSETSSFAVISVILAESLTNSIGAEDGYIQVRVPSNMRANTGALTDRCFLNTVYLTYDVARATGKPIDFMATGFRSQMDIATDYDCTIYKITEMDKTTKMVNENPEMLKKIIDPIIDKTFNDEAKVMYTHVNRHGFDDELVEHIRMFQILPGMIDNIDDPVLTLNAAIASNFNGKIYLSLYHKIKDDIWENNIEKALKKYGIPYQLSAARLVPKILYDYGE